MLEVASAAGDVLPCLFLQANDNEATQELVGCCCLVASQLLLSSVLRTAWPRCDSCCFPSHSSCNSPSHVCFPCLPQADAIGEACSQLAVKPPASYSGPRPGAPLYHAVVATAQQPELAIPETPSLKVRPNRC